MLRFECDYGEGAAPAVLELMQKTNFDQTPGYGEDSYCAAAADKIRALCDAEDPKKVLSDDALVDLLKAEGFDLARRTVAKYREAIGIGSSVQRRRAKKLGGM